MWEAAIVVPISKNTAGAEYPSFGSECGEAGSVVTRRKVREK